MLTDAEDNLIALRERVARLDHELTGKHIEICRRQSARSYTLYDLISGGVYYLSDGGYSRFGYEIETGELYLTYNSLDRVKVEWASGRELVEKYKAEVTRLVEALWGMASSLKRSILI